MVTRTRLQLYGGILLMALAFGSYVWRWDLYLRLALGVAGTYMLGSLGSPDRWQSRLAIVLVANVPILLYLLLHRP